MVCIRTWVGVYVDGEGNRIGTFESTTSTYSCLPVREITPDICSLILIDPDDPYKLSEDTRGLGIVVCRGTAVVLICPVDGMEAIANPFVQQEA